MKALGGSFSPKDLKRWKLAGKDLAEMAAIPADEEKPFLRRSTLPLARMVRFTSRRLTTRNRRGTISS